MFYICLFSIIPVVAALQPRQNVLPASIPDYALRYAPLVYLDQNEVYFPSDIQAHLNNTIPKVNFTAASATIPSFLSYSNLDEVNSIGNCNINNTRPFNGCDIFLTSKDDVNTNPPWLNGVLPDPENGKTGDAKTSAIIVNDGRTDGFVDVYYMYFYSYNRGPTVAGQILGDHVGDWEHNMIRFQNGNPVTVWYSQHADGQAFTYSSLSKGGLAGIRPIVYSALGSHANYAVPGRHNRPFDANDYTSQGPLWDPTLSTLFYNYRPATTGPGTFVALNTVEVADWLYFLGRWGDKRLPDSDPRQVNFLNLSLAWRYDGGPTGPLDKDLSRNGTCPAGQTSCVTLSDLPATISYDLPITVTRTSATGRTADATASTTATGTQPGGAQTSTVSSGGRMIRGSIGITMMIGLVGVSAAWGV